MSGLNASANPATEPRRVWLWVRVSVTIFVAAALILLGVVALIFFNQHSMIYHPRPYAPGYGHALAPNGIEIEYVLPWGRQTAYYIPPAQQSLKRIWVAFCGNGSLALDWMGLVRRFPANGDGFLLIDYPGYGRNAGYATIESNRATANAALSALAKRLNTNEDRLPLCVIGHSLGAAAALDFATHHSIQRVVLISPFTTLREEAAHVFGGPLSRLLVENYDNRKNLRELFRNNSELRAAIFHGTQDALIPVQMGYQLKREFPAVEFFPIEHADHGTVVYLAEDQIISWMSK